jgi:murein DD-endopeptidase MepM/ murein hydrolase activator NlpD
VGKKLSGAKIAPIGHLIRLPNSGSWPGSGGRITRTLGRAELGLLRLVFLLALVLLAMSSPVQASPEDGKGRQPAGPTQEAFHIVQRGETLFSIAQRYGSTVDAFAHTNGISDPAKIYVGQRLKIPFTGGFDIDPLSTVAYLVQPTDTLADVARRHATSWEALAWVNGLLSPDVLYAGQIIQVPPTDPAGGFLGALHVVSDDETLLGIALHHDVAPWALTRANQVLNPALLYPGQELLIPGEASSRLPAPFVSVNVHPLPVSQGGTVVIDVRTSQPVTLSGRLFEGTIRFAEEKGVYYGLAGVHAFTEPGLYELTLEATDDGGRSTEVTADVVVEAAWFGYERIKAAPDLLDPAVVAAERERINALRPTFTEKRGWSRTLQRPCGGTVSSYFGTRRAYNDGPYTSYHAGVDLRGPTGTPVYAAAAGTVVLAEPLTVRGNAVMLDHGWGMLTGYWHLSKIEVEVGQHVQQGDLIARIGSTGLSTGSHLHWEMWVGGVNVNPMEWLDPFYAWPEPVESSANGVGG